MKHKNIILFITLFASLILTIVIPRFYAEYTYATNFNNSILKTSQLSVSKPKYPTPKEDEVVVYKNKNKNILIKNEPNLNEASIISLLQSFNFPIYKFSDNYEQEYSSLTKYIPNKDFKNNLVDETDTYILYHYSYNNVAGYKIFTVFFEDGTRESTAHQLNASIGFCNLDNKRFVFNSSDDYKKYDIKSKVLEESFIGTKGNYKTYMETIKLNKNIYFIDENLNENYFSHFYIEFSSPTMSYEQLYKSFDDLKL